MRFQSMRTGLLAIIALILFSAVSIAQTPHVNRPGASPKLGPDLCVDLTQGWDPNAGDRIIVPVDHHSIQDAIDAASDGDQILVQPGTYIENINFKGKAITLRSIAGAHTTEINGRLPPDPDFGSVVTFDSGESMRSKLIGFTIREGCGTVNWPSGSSCGGGIFCKGASPSILNNIIIENTTHLADGTPGDDTLNNHGVGAGCFFSYSNATLINNLIVQNIADNKGGGIACGEANITLRNVTIADNEAEDSGGAIYASTNSVLNMDCSIIWDNSALLGPGIVLRGESRLHISFCTVKGGFESIVVDPGASLVYWGMGMKSMDPLFVSNSQGDYHLCQIAAGQDVDSPCVDAGHRGTFCYFLNQRWTRTDKVPDRGLVDMGFHYLIKLK